MSDYTPNTTPSKQCSRCKQFFPATIEYFGTDKRYNTFASRCRNCARIAAAEWAEKNRERTRQRAKEWVKNNPERFRKNQRRWIEKNKEYVRDLHRKASKKRHENDPSYGRTRTLRHVARKRNLPDTFTTEDWQNALTYFCGCCAVCGRPINGLFHTANADHWIPLSSPNCPGTIAANIVPLCGGIDGCNQSKGDKMPKEWLVEKVGKRKATSILKKIEAYFDHVLNARTRHQ